MTAGNRRDLAFLNGVYQTLLGRHPTKQELGALTTRLKKKTPRATIVRELWNSADHRALQASQLYMTYLHRLPTPFERASVIQQLQFGAEEPTIAAQLVSTSEYLAAHPTTNALIGGLYLDLVGKLPDIGAQQGLAQALGNQTVSAAVQNLVASPGARQFTADNIYRAMLHRPATPGEMQFGALQLQTGVTPSQLAINLLASAEFYRLAFASVVK